MSEGRKRPWNVAVGSFIVFGLLVGYGRCFGIFYTVIMEKYETNNAGAALIYSIQNIVRICTVPFMLPLMRRYGVRWVTMAAGLLHAAGTVSAVAYPSLITLYVTIGGICGVASSVLFLTPILAVNHSFMGDSLHGTAMGIATAGCGAGTLLFSPINEAVLAEYGLDGAFIITGAILLHFCVGGALFGDLNMEKSSSGSSVPSVSEHTSLLSEDTKLSATGSVADKSNGFPVSRDSLTYSYRLKRQVKSLWSATREISSVQLLFYLLNNFCAMIVIFSNFLFLDKLGEELLIPHSGIAIVLIVIGVCDIIGRLFFGYIFDIKLARNRKHFFLAISAVLCGLSTASLGYAKTYQQMIVLAALYGILMGGFAGQIFTALPDLVPAHYVHETTLITTTLQAIGLFLGPVLQGAVVDYFDTYTIAYTGTGFIQAFLALLTVLHYCLDEFCFSRLCRQKEYDELYKT